MARTIRYRNGDREIRELELAVREFPKDLNARIALGSALLRAGTPISDDRVATGIIGQNYQSGQIDLARIRMGARVVHENGDRYAPAVTVLACLGKKPAHTIPWQFMTGVEAAVVPLDLSEQVDLAADFAEMVLPVFQEAYPDDDRPMQAINLARTFVADPDAVDYDDAAFAYEQARSAADMADMGRLQGQSSEAYYAANAAKNVGWAVEAALTDSYQRDVDEAVANVSYNASITRPALRHQVRIIQLQHYMCRLLKLDTSCVLPPLPLGN